MNIPLVPSKASLIAKINKMTLEDTEKQLLLLLEEGKVNYSVGTSLEGEGKYWYLITLEYYAGCRVSGQPTTPGTWAGRVFTSQDGATWTFDEEDGDPRVGNGVYNLLLLNQ